MRHEGKYCNANAAKNIRGTEEKQPLTDIFFVREFE
jgi:hypothetical protein